MHANTYQVYINTESRKAHKKACALDQAGGDTLISLMNSMGHSREVAPHLTGTQKLAEKNTLAWPWKKKKKKNASVTRATIS